MYDNFRVTKIKYIMYNVQDYSVLFNNLLFVRIDMTLI